jgi:hypothetical protein
LFVDFLLQVKVCQRHVIGFFVSYHQFGEPAKGGSGFAGFISGKEEGALSYKEDSALLKKTEL